MCASYCTLFDLGETKSTNCAATNRMNHLVSFSVVLLESVYTHDCCFPLGGIECPLQAKDLHLLVSPHIIPTNVHTHTLARVALSQINPQIQADNLKEYLEINGNGI